MAGRDIRHGTGCPSSILQCGRTGRSGHEARPSEGRRSDGSLHGGVGASVAKDALGAAAAPGGNDEGADPRKEPTLVNSFEPQLPDGEISGVGPIERGPNGEYTSPQVALADIDHRIPPRHGA